ncbi:MAG: hypothetical protein V4555_11685 [Acidobacteriota bacterium]
MLDVHPPHDAAHTWRDFFIHIATIVIGLLIAIGLEQTVEYLHHRHQLAETREALREEHEINRKFLAFRVIEFRRFNAILEGNLDDFLYLRQHPGTPLANLPHKINWNGSRTPIQEAAWTSARQDNITQFMNTNELHDYENFYDWLESTSQRFDDFRKALSDARVYTTRDFDPSHLTPQQLDNQIELTQKAIYLHYNYGMGLWSLALNYPDLPAPTLTEIEAIVHENPTDGTGVNTEIFHRVEENPAPAPAPATSPAK